MLRGAHWQYLQGLPCCGGLIDSIYRDYHAAGGGGLMDSIYRDYHAAGGGGSLTVSTEITMLRGAHWQYLQRLPCCGGGVHWQYLQGLPCCGGSLTVSTGITMLRGAHWHYLHRLPCCGGGGGSLTVSMLRGGGLIDSIGDKRSNKQVLYSFFFFSLFSFFFFGGGFWGAKTRFAPTFWIGGGGAAAPLPPPPPPPTSGAYECILFCLKVHKTFGDDTPIVWDNSPSILVRGRTVPRASCSGSKINTVPIGQSVLIFHVIVDHERVPKNSSNLFVPQGGGGGHSTFTVDGGGGVPLGVENLTLSQCARCTKNTPCHNIPY